MAKKTKKAVDRCVGIRVEWREAAGRYFAKRGREFRVSQADADRLRRAVREHAWAQRYLRDLYWSSPKREVERRKFERAKRREAARVWRAQLAKSPELTDEALRERREVLALLRKDEITPEEHQRVIRYARGQGLS